MTPDESTIYAQLGQQINHARRDAGLTQDQLAAHLDLTRSSVANIETGRQAISAYSLLRLHGLLGIAFPGLKPDQADAPERGCLARENDALRERIATARRALAGSGQSQPTPTEEQQ